MSVLEDLQTAIGTGGMGLSITLAMRAKDEIERLREEVEHYKKDNIRLKKDKMVLFRALMKIRAIEGGDVFEMIKEMKSIADIAIKEMG